MATLMQRVQKVLEKEFSSKEILLEPAGRGMVDGWIISNSFDGLSDLERQQKIHGLLERHFNPQDRRHILTIFTLTPLEKKIIIDEDSEGAIYLPMKKNSPSVYGATKRVRKGVVNGRRSSGNARAASKVR